MSGIQFLKQFDPRQLFRLFVDGRFQSKYRGWVGYEKGERGSVQGMLNGFAYMLDNFNIFNGVKGTYLLNLHKICMANVQTANPKSTPGDLRYLNSGMPFLAKTTTLNNLREVLAMRKGDGTTLFNTKKYAKTADEFDAESLYKALLKEKNINYRNWYPNLDNLSRHYLEQNGNLQDFYQVKHYVQMLFAKKTDQLIDNFNRKIKKASDNDKRLHVIAELIRDLELLHPFPDGNCRVFACILLNHLLLYFDFHPAILENPNLDGECSYEEFVDEIRKGMDNTKALLENPDMRLFGFSILDATPEETASFLRMADGFIRRIRDFREIYLTPERLQLMTGGEWLNHDPFLRFTGTGSHSTFREGYLYFALGLEEWKKENIHPEEQIAELFRKGIRAIVLDDRQLAETLPYPVLIVNDCLQAFKEAAAATRNQVGCSTVLITGTEGKTGAKVQLYHVLKRQTQIHAALNSANTETPVLRSLLNLSDGDRVEVNEVSVGNNEELRVERARLVNPDICYYTNIGPNHMDLHKTLDNLIYAKSSVVEGLRENGICIVNREMVYYDPLIENIRKRRRDVPICLYGTRQGVNARLLQSSFDTGKFGWHITADIEGEHVSYFIPYFQGHAPLASVGILLLVKKLGYDVRQAARDFRANAPYETMGRLLVIRKNKEDILFYDQSRRGAMHGMTSAFNDLKRFQVKGKIVALVGGISTLKESDWTREAHHILADLINESPISRLYTTGNFMEHVHENLRDKSILVRHSDNLDELAENLVSDCGHGDLLFIIGNAYLYLGRVADAILKKHRHEIFDAAVHGPRFSRRRPDADLPPAEIALSANPTLLIIFEGAGSEYGSATTLLSETAAEMHADRIVLRDLDSSWHHRGVRGISRDIYGTIAFLKKKIEEKNHGRVVCAGIAAGGYAALLVGSTLKADEILAFSPHTFLDRQNRELHADNRREKRIGGISDFVTPIHSDLSRTLESSLTDRTVVHIYACREDPLDTAHTGHLSSFDALCFHLFDGPCRDIGKYLRNSGAAATIMKRALSSAMETRIISAFNDIEEGTAEAEACSRNNVPPKIFQQYRNTYGNVDSFRGSLLFHFFQGIEEHLAQERHFAPMNEKLRATGAEKFLYNEHVCQEWFLNLKKKKGERKVQMFGTFLDFGNPEYLLHIAVGTAHLHAGLASCSLLDGRVTLQPMSRLHLIRITGRLNDKLPRSSPLQERKWGPVWCSMDCGSFIDLEQEHIYRTMSAFRTSPWYRDAVTPLLDNLHVLG